MIVIVIVEVVVDLGKEAEIDYIIIDLIAKNIISIMIGRKTEKMMIEIDVIINLIITSIQQEISVEAQDQGEEVKAEIQNLNLMIKIKPKIERIKLRKYKIQKKRVRLMTKLPPLKGAKSKRK